MRHIGSADGDTAVAFLRQVAELVAIDNLPAPVTVSVWNRSVLVRADDLPVWCRALSVPEPEFVPGDDGKVAFACVDVLGFELEANRPLVTAVAS